MPSNDLKRIIPASTVMDDNAPVGGKKNKETGNGEDEKARKEESWSTAHSIIELAMGNCQFFHDERSNAYSIVTDKDIQRTVKLHGKLFHRWLAGAFYKTAGRPASNEALSTALLVLEAKAIYECKQRELFNRFAMHDNVIHIDMAGHSGRAVKVTAEGWRVLEKAPIMFRRYSHQQALPKPVGGEKLSIIHRHLAIRSNDDKYLLEAFLVACAFSNVPRPAITFYGPQGASKTTTARCIKAITDPSLLGSIDLGSSPADLAQNLDHHGVPCLDNLTRIPQWAADMLCRAITGGAFSKRELYSDDSDVLLSFMRPIIITGINIPSQTPDLLDRLLLIELDRISPRKRLDEATFWANFDKDRSKLFGALLDAIAGTLKQLPNIKLTRMARMADFTRIACAYAEYIGIGSRKMLAIIMRHTARQTEEVLEADLVATSIVNLIKKERAWTGTATELLELLNQNARRPRPQDWPKQPNSLTKKMNTLHATLNEGGIKFTKGKGRRHGRKLTLEYKTKPSSPSSSVLEGPVDKGLLEDGTPEL
jgi:hypothetical protein